MDPYKFMFAQREKYGDLFTFVLIGRKMTVGLGPKVRWLLLRLLVTSGRKVYELTSSLAVGLVSRRETT
jgi:hypothetical protein